MLSFTIHKKLNIGKGVVASAFREMGRWRMAAIFPYL